MPRKHSALGYKAARTFTLSKGRWAWTATFTCPVDATEVTTKILKVYDEAGMLFPGAVCPMCHETILFQDQFGNSVRWPSKTVISPIPGRDEPSNEGDDADA